MGNRLFKAWSYQQMNIWNQCSFNYRMEIERTSGKGMKILVKISKVTSPQKIYKRISVITAKKNKTKETRRNNSYVTQNNLIKPDF